MSKEEVKLFIDDDRRLYVKTKTGIEYEVSIFSGGGYYEAIMLQTEKERLETAKKREEQDKKWLEELKTKDSSRKKKWWKR